MPKYNSIWDVDQVLTWLITLDRVDLAALNLNQRWYVPEGVVSLPSHLSKQSRLSHHGVEFFLPYFEDELVICPVETLKVYEHKTF